MCNLLDACSLDLSAMSRNSENLNRFSHTLIKSLLDCIVISFVSVEHLKTIQLLLNLASKYYVVIWWLPRLRFIRFHNRLFNSSHQLLYTSICYTFHFTSSLIRTYLKSQIFESINTNQKFIDICTFSFLYPITLVL